MMMVSGIMLVLYDGGGDAQPLHGPADEPHGAPHPSTPRPRPIADCSSRSEYCATMVGRLLLLLALCTGGSCFHMPASPCSSVQIDCGVNAAQTRRLPRLAACCREHDCRSARRLGTRLAAAGSGGDAEFEQWYAETKVSSGAGPHVAGDVVASGQLRWRIVGEGRMENPASDATAPGSPVWVYDAEDADGTGTRVQILALALRDMGGSWTGLDSLRTQAQTCLSLDVPGIPR